MLTISRSKNNVRGNLFTGILTVLLIVSTLIPLSIGNSAQPASPAVIFSEIIKYTNQHDAFSPQQSEDNSGFFYAIENIKLIKISSTGIFHPFQNKIESNNAANSFSSFADASCGALHRDLISTFLLLDIPPPASIII